MMKVPIDFVQFLKTGDFGPLKLGDERSKVLALLGAPGHWDGPAGTVMADACTFHYHGILVMFDDTRVASISLSTKVDWEESPIEWQGSCIGDHFSVEDFKAYLMYKGVAFSSLATSDDHSDAALQTEGGVLAYARHRVFCEPLEDGSGEIASYRSPFRYVATLVVQNPEKMAAKRGKK